MKNTSQPQSVLVVDDDRNVLEVLDARLSSCGLTVHKADGGRKALGILKTHRIDLVVSDVKMPEMDGPALLAEIIRTKPGLPVIFLTAYANVPDAVKAVKSGAVDYVEKPFDGKALTEKIQSILRDSEDEQPGRTAEPEPAPDSDDDTISPAMKNLHGLVKKVARSNVNVLVLGESGVGKERIANRIHQMGPRRKNPFVVVDCGATPAGLLESELFGHVKGSFTHAVSDKKGLIETADTGTLFLDEIGNISHEMQIRLLRFIEDRTIRRIGGLKGKPVDCRIIAATNADLGEAIKAGQFREDLFFRLRVVTLTIPPLRDRKADIPLLVDHFVRQFCRQQQVETVRIPEETMGWLCDYSWPGNVRELKNAIEGGIVLCRNNTLRPEDFHLTGITTDACEQSTADDNCLSLEESEKNTILRALEQTGGIQKEAAEVLGISRRAIHYKIKKYGIDAGSIKARH
ncbi:sigma-54-dependent Fis family transcriptional regulator [Desulfosarcina alkanivorans]|jgi:DNA-binding NtrC family response regulator|uniref:Sigma-54-dependent Fis family transcriptional regulator n=1 Tax=Desulfosarcina alkanivorans TaxID=571177 RepID=A0A5K7YL50_9BACT|nr:sigma-54 dependent transcriptional regulator [Desulfosarcina alkanivorans]BBO69243.1 sigma-54-dependent Fis family transcriptional regulator [Desulfosarcina alkanivorans]